MCKVTADEVLILKDYPELGIKRGDNLYEALDGMAANAVPDPIDFIIGDGNQNTPLVDTNIYSNSSLKDRKFYILRNGLGKLHPGIHYTVLSTGGFQLMQSNDVFATGEEWSIIFY